MEICLQTNTSVETGECYVELRHEILLINWLCLVCCKTTTLEQNPMILRYGMFNIDEYCSGGGGG